MARLHTSFVLGYHGCDSEVGKTILADQYGMAASNKDYDWLGPGVYFWEADPTRAWEWADAKVASGSISEPFVIGAAIDLGNCLDLMARDNLEILVNAYQSLSDVTNAAGDQRSLPENRGRDGDKLLRFLDCAVIRYLHEIIKEKRLAPFDSVRGLFSEGDDLYPGSGFKKKTHTQLSICNPDCIKGYFRVPRA
jgi:hypothetical protein